MPNFPDISMVADVFEDVATIRYYGTPNDLIAAGVATTEMLTPGRPGRKVRDQEGDRYTVQRYFRLGEDNQPYRYCRLTRRKAIGLVDRLPGAFAAIAADKAFRQWYDDRSAARIEEHRQREQPPRGPKLSLVVDNTR
jgi:hypothetical protein